MIRFEGVSFRYQGSDNGIFDINLTVAAGECVVLCGVSGCGKTTVTRMVSALIPSFYHGKKEGRVLVRGSDVEDLRSWEVGGLVGSVFQDPKSQFFSTELTGEVAFACENRGLDRMEIRRRTDGALAVMGLDALRSQAVDTLSSGEQQRVAIASVYALTPTVLVFDEPTANMDATGMAQLRKTVLELKRRGLTLLVAEHRIAWLDGIADRYLYLRAGRICRQFLPSEMRALPNIERHRMGLRSAIPVPLPHLPAPHGARLAIQCRGLACRRGNTQVWRGLDLSFFTHRVTAIIGPNGVGKTTLGLVLSGLLRQREGEVIVNGRRLRPARRRRELWFCANNTGTQFFTNSVSDELLMSMREHSEKDIGRARDILRRMGLYQYRDAHPACLSGGQRQRLAIACALLSDRNILVLDEPTSGLDAANMRIIATELKTAAAGGRCVLVITHDTELVAECCDSAVSLG
ncbi:MAG: ABC transporter ATP-binding protein [Olsenella sp.]